MSMDLNISISISRKVSYCGAGIPDCEKYIVDAVFDSDYEHEHLGFIEFENAADLVVLRDALDSYIDEYGLEFPPADSCGDSRLGTGPAGEAPEKGGES